MCCISTLPSLRSAIDPREAAKTDAHSPGNPPVGPIQRSNEFIGQSIALLSHSSKSRARQFAPARLAHDVPDAVVAAARTTATPQLQCCRRPVSLLCIGTVRFLGHSAPRPAVLLRILDTLHN